MSHHLQSSFLNYIRLSHGSSIISLWHTSLQVQNTAFSWLFSFQMNGLCFISFTVSSSSLLSKTWWFLAVMILCLFVCFFSKIHSLSVLSSLLVLNIFYTSVSQSVQSLSCVQLFVTPYSLICISSTDISPCSWQLYMHIYKISQNDSTIAVICFLKVVISIASLFS